MSDWIARIDSCIDNRWSFQFGDATEIGWLATGVYALTCFSCFIASTRTDHIAKNVRNHRFFWLVLAIILAFLSLNKQLDLQTLLTAAGRCIAQDGGWFEYRREMQTAFFIGFASFCIAIAVSAIIYALPAFLSNGMASAGILILILIVLYRAADATHVAGVLQIPVVQKSVTGLIEIAASLMILGGSLENKTPRRPDKSDSPFNR